MTETDDEQADFRRFEMMAGHIRTIAETMLTEFFGERCPDYEPTCVNCQRWRLLDGLTQNPFDDGSERKSDERTDLERIDWLERRVGASLVSDDAGNWAVASDGIQFKAVSQDVQTTFWIDKDRWRDTVRDAVDLAMDAD